MRLKKNHDEWIVGEFIGRSFGADPRSTYRYI